MEKLPADFDLSSFVGAEANMISIGLFQMDIDFIPPVNPVDPNGYVGISGAWELALNGELVDASEERSREGNQRRQNYRVHRLLGLRVTGWTAEPPWAFRLVFEGGYSLRVVDDTEGAYEYVHITRPGETERRWIL